jgi:anti-sigma factor RsiW
MALPAALTCKELVEIVTAYVEGTLPPEDRARFDDHLAGCSGCRNYLQQMVTTIRLTGGLAEEALPAETRAVLLDLFRDWKTSSGA